MSGSVLIWKPPAIFVGTVSELNDGIIRVELAGHDAAWLWLAAWNVDAERVAEIESTWGAAVGKILAER